MRLQIDWGRPIKLSSGAPTLIYLVDHNRLPTSPGVYVFGRRHGASFEALYVGKATSLRSRVRRQQKNLPLMLHLQNAKSGDRVLLAGKFTPKANQRTDKSIAIIEKALIRFFLAKGHDLVNIQGTLLRRHEITSAGARKTIPEFMFVDRAKGE